MRKRTVLITGSTSGIGLGIAKAFAATGYHLVFNGLEPDGATIAESVATQYGTGHLFSSANMLEPQAIRDMVDAANERFGVIDVLVVNAGIQHVAPIENFPVDKWNSIIAVNLTAAFHLSKAVWPGMKAQGFGRIINIASAHGLVASENKSAYVAAKHGLIGFTKSAALEGAAVGITCNAICPGFVNTPLVQKQVRDLAQAQEIPEQDVVSNVILARHAIKEFVPPETIAAVCLFLASEAAATITGIAMPVDAGWTAR